MRRTQHRDLNGHPARLLKEHEVVSRSNQRIVGFTHGETMRDELSNESSDACTKNRAGRERSRIPWSLAHLARNTMNSILLAALAIVIVAPYFYFFDLVFRLLFPSPLNLGIVAQLIAILYLLIGITIYFVLVVYTWKWLKRNADSILGRLQIKNNDKTHS
jgi:hypothetical protein